MADLSALRTGDLLLKAATQPNLEQRTIMQVCSTRDHRCVHSHDELVELEDGPVRMMTATTPRMKWTPWEERIEEYRKGEIVFAVYRLAQFAGLPDEAWRDRRMLVSGALRMAVACELPYDVPGVGMIWLRWLLKGALPQFKDQLEFMLWCTESGWKAWGCANVALPPQPRPAPCHTEQAVRSGAFVLVPGFDFGLHDLIMVS